MSEFVGAVVATGPGWGAGSRVDLTKTLQKKVGRTYIDAYKADGV